jgi:hypothetical protein
MGHDSAAAVPHSSVTAPDPPSSLGPLLCSSKQFGTGWRERHEDPRFVHREPAARDRELDACSPCRHQLSARSLRRFLETDVEETDLENVIRDLLEGQYSNPVRVVGFNTAEGWARDEPSQPEPATEAVEHKINILILIVAWHDERGHAASPELHATEPGIKRIVFESFQARHDGKRRHFKEQTIG